MRASVRERKFLKYLNKLPTPSSIVSSFTFHIPLLLLFSSRFKCCFTSSFSCRLGLVWLFFLAIAREITPLGNNTLQVSKIVSTWYIMLFQCRKEQARRSKWSHQTILYIYYICRERERVFFYKNTLETNTHTQTHKYNTTFGLQYNLHYLNQFPQ